MKPIHFTKDEGSAFYKELNQEIKKYFRRNNIAKTGNRKMYLKMTMYFSLVLLFYVTMLFSESTLIFISSYLFMGLAVLLTAFNVSHDAAHGVAVKSKFWNKILFEISFNLQGNNAYVWGKNHNESHHLYTNIEGSDIDVLNNPLVRMTPNQSLKWFHKYQFLYVPVLYLLYSLNWFLFREFLMLFRFSSRTIKVSIPPVEVVKLVLFKLCYIGYMIVLPFYLTEMSLGLIIGVFILNHFVISLIFTAVLGVSHLSDYVEHPEVNEHQVLPISWAKLQMVTSVDYNVDSSFLNWVLGGFNAHSLHHLLPNICHVHYVDILPIFRRLAKKHGITYLEMPYSEALKSHFRFLKKMGSQQHPKIQPYAI